MFKFNHKRAKCCLVINTIKYKCNENQKKKGNLNKNPSQNVDC